MILCLFVLLATISTAADTSFKEREYSQHLDHKFTNIWNLDEISNACVSGGSMIMFSPESSPREYTKTLSILGLKVKTENSKFANRDNKYKLIGSGPVIFLQQMVLPPTEDTWVPYRLMNSILSLHRRGVRVEDVKDVVLQRDTDKLFDQYKSLMLSYLGLVKMNIMNLDNFCAQHLIVVTPQELLRDMSYQFDVIHLRKLVYEGHPKFPIPVRKPKYSVNLRKKAPMFTNPNVIYDFFGRIVRNRFETRYFTFEEMPGSDVVKALKDTDVLLTVSGPEALYLIYMMPYSVLTEFMPDYVHDSTATQLAYISDIYPIVIRDVLTPIPSECKQRGQLVLSEEEPCRSALYNRNLEFDYKWMTEAVTQAEYYLKNYKMKVVDF